MSRRRTVLRILFVLGVLLVHHGGASSMARWDVGNRLLAGGVDRWVGVALLLVFLGFRLATFVGLPLLLSWWLASALCSNSGTGLDDSEPRRR